MKYSCTWALYIHYLSSKGIVGGYFVGLWFVICIIYFFLSFCMNLVFHVFPVKQVLVWGNSMLLVIELTSVCLGMQATGCDHIYLQYVCLCYFDSLLSMIMRLKLPSIDDVYLEKTALFSRTGLETKTFEFLRTTCMITDLSYWINTHGLLADATPSIRLKWLGFLRIKMIQ